jgi:hypothetical protein
VSNSDEEWHETREGHLFSSIEDGGLGSCIVLGLAGRDATWMNGLRIEPGIFRYGHQTAGLSCNHQEVCGAILPLARCKTPRIVSALEEITAVFDGDYAEAMSGPSLSQINRVSLQLEKAGLSCERTFRQIEEAYIPFDINERSYDWLAQHFEMLTVLRESNRYRAEIIESRPLRWPSFKLLLESLLGPSHFIGSGVFLFENSD